MTKPRVVETDQGIQGEFNVSIYDQMQRRLRDKGFIGTDEIIKSGIDSGMALEIGPGPGYLGLEWLKKTNNTQLKGLDISADMISMAEKNANDYNLSDRVKYVESSGDKIPFEDDLFDAVFTNGSLHEWNHPVDTMKEMWRVLKPGGRIFISDLRRDMNPLIKWLMWFSTKPKEIRPGLVTSINAAYTTDELKNLISEGDLAGCQVKGNPFGLSITGIKKK